MRYLFIQYYKKPDGKIDEAMTVAKRLRDRDLQMTSIILDFKDLKVVKAVIDSKALPRDWDRIVSYYYEYYAKTIEQLFEINGHPISIKNEMTTDTETTEDQSLYSSNTDPIIG
jgi:aminopeptidase N